jgi:hypothetical protein
MFMILELGVFGALLLLGAWIFETFEAVKHHKAMVDLRFAVVYAFGNAFLTAYSYLKGDMVFLSISGTILAIVLAEITYTLWLLRRRR